MLKGMEAMQAINAQLEEGTVVVGLEPIANLNLVDLPIGVGDIYYGELRVGGFGTGTGRAIELEKVAPLVADKQYRDEAIDESENKNIGTVLFNKVTQMNKVDAWFEGYKVITASVAVGS